MDGELICHKVYLISTFCQIMLQTCINECNITNGGSEQICTNLLAAFPAASTSWMDLTKQYPLFAFKYVFFSSMQTSTSVRLAVITVTRMHSALTQRGVSPALVTQATMEMESPAQVSEMNH